MTSLVNQNQFDSNTTTNVTNAVDNDPDLITARILASASLSTPTKQQIPDHINNTLSSNDNHMRLKRQSSGIKNLCNFTNDSTNATSLLATTTNQQQQQQQQQATSTNNTNSAQIEPSNTHASTFNKFNKLFFTQTTSCSSSTGKSSTYSSSSSSSSTSSCSSGGSNDTPILTNPSASTTSTSSGTSSSSTAFSFNFYNTRTGISSLNQLHSTTIQSPAGSSTTTTTTTTTSSSSSVSKPIQKQQMSTNLSNTPTSTKSIASSTTLNKQKLNTTTGANLSTSLVNDSHQLTQSGSNSSLTSSSSSSSTATNLTPSSSTTLIKPFNIENELIKYTKTLKLTNNYLSTYKLGDHIRNGGFSEIYEGHHLKNKDNVIIKLIPKHKTKNWLMVHNKKYPAEVLLHKMSNNISGVVRMMDFFEQDHEWIIIMPKLINCVDLFDYLESKHRGRLTEPEACHFFTQLVKINIDLLNHGVVHRDLKSENLLVDLDTMKLILIDFGASAIFRHNQTQPQFYTDFHGTRQYKPPEYIMHKKYMAQSSTIWTLGILLYDMCNGQLPFETEQEVLDYNIQMKATVSDDYKEILFDCLKQDPLHRPSLLQLLNYKWCLSNSNMYIPKNSNNQASSSSNTTKTTSTSVNSKGSNSSTSASTISNLINESANSNPTLNYKQQTPVDSISSSSPSSSSSSHSSTSSSSGLVTTTTQLTHNSKFNLKI